MKFILSCCSPVDLTSEHLKNKNVPYLPFHYMIGNQELIDDLGTTLSYDEFYQAMVDGADTKTMQVNIEEYTEYFNGLLNGGLPVLHLTLSSGLSGTYNSAVVAAQAINEEYGKQMVYIVDSLGASSGYGLLVDKLVSLRDNDIDIESAYAWAQENKLRVHHWFYSTDLTFFVRGGRVSKVSGFVGTLLKICPLLNVSNEGKLIPRQKVVGKRATAKACLDKMVQFADNGIAYDDSVFISHSHCYDDAIYLKNLIEEKFPAVRGKILINDIGSTIGCHAGPGTVALFFWGKARND